MRATLRSVLGILAVALSMGATASAAIASPEWESVTPQWAQAGSVLKGTVNTAWKGTVQITDSKTEVAVQCEENAEGTVGTSGTGTVTSMTFSKCSVINTGLNCNVLESMSAVGLPWHTELSISHEGGEPVWHDKISNEGKHVGFVFKCYFSAWKVKLTDECSAASLTEEMEDIHASVQGTFANEAVYCSIGGAGTGAFKGSQTIEARSGGELELGIGFYSPLTSAVTTKATGAIKMEDGPAKFGMECNVETTGTLEPLGAGTITGLVPTSCKGSGVCVSAELAAGLALPWKTTLSEPAAWMTLSGTGGSPSWEVDCKGEIVRYSDECLLPKFRVENLGGKASEYPGEELTNCRLGGAKTGKWSGHLTIVPPANIEAIRVS